MNVHYDHPILLLQHMLWHEGYHHGQMKLALKLAGRPIANEEARAAHVAGVDGQEVSGRILGSSLFRHLRVAARRRHALNRMATQRTGRTVRLILRFSPEISRIWLASFSPHQYQESVGVGT